MLLDQYKVLFLPRASDVEQIWGVKVPGSLWSLRDGGHVTSLWPSGDRIPYPLPSKASQFLCGKPTDSIRTDSFLMQMHTKGALFVKRGRFVLVPRFCFQLPPRHPIVLFRSRHAINWGHSPSNLFGVGSVCGGNDAEMRVCCCYRGARIRETIAA